MASYNKVILLGNLTRDPELRTTPNGTAICQFGLATNRKFSDAAGNVKEDVVFIDVEAWGKQAETLCRFFGKGKPILVEGRLKLDTWDDKTTGQKRSRHKIVCEAWQFSAEGRESPSNAGNGASERPTGPASPPHRPAAPAQDINDEDVPF